MDRPIQCRLSCDAAVRRKENLHGVCSCVQDLNESWPPAAEIMCPCFFPSLVSGKGRVRVTFGVLSSIKSNKIKYKFPYKKYAACGNHCTSNFVQTHGFEN